jgi:hypothetical protein
MGTERVLKPTSHFEKRSSVRQFNYKSLPENCLNFSKDNNFLIAYD